MKPTRFQQLVKECLQEILDEVEGRRVCAWCKKDMGAIGDGQPGDSHGICPTCAAEFQKQINAMKPQSSVSTTKQAGSNLT